MGREFLYFCLFFSAMIGCSAVSPESLRETYSVSDAGGGRLSATVEVRATHEGVQDQISQNAFNTICGTAATITGRTVSAPFDKQTTYTQQSWHAASGQMIQTASFPVNTPHVRISYEFACS